MGVFASENIIQADMNYYNKSGQMDLTDRVAIETGLCRGESFKKIAKRIRRHPTTVAHEVFENRTYIKGTNFAGKDCRHVRTCAVKNLCDGSEDACNYRCKHCRGYDCTKMCKRYESVACHKPDKPPYVCNTCKDRKLCIKDKYVYSAPYADAAVSRRRSESRQGIHLTEEQKVFVDELVTRLVKKGQPLTHIYAEHEALKWSDVFLEDKLIMITHMIDIDNNYCEYNKSHETEGMHELDLSDRAIMILEKIKSKNYGFRDDFIFLGKNENYLLTEYCNKNIHRACKALVINKNFTTHDCRRYAATQAALRGMSTAALQNAFGWKDKDTAEHYVQVAAAKKEQKRVLVDVLN